MKTKTITLFVILSVQLVFGQSQFDHPAIKKLCNKGVYEAATMHEYYSPIEDKADMCIPKNNGIPNSNWYSWTIKHPGYIEFLITPSNLQDDIDFEVYLDAGPNDLRVVRCMASGPNVGAGEQDLCLGATGMIADKSNIRETLGCNPSKTNFTAPIYTVKGDTYFLRVINFSSDNGFSLNIDGTAMLAGAFETGITCDVSNNKTFQFNPILNETEEMAYTFQWSFGANAIPERGNKKTPWPVRYESEGSKQILLETWNKEGCYQQAFHSLLINASQVVNKPEGVISTYPNPFFDWTNISVDSRIPEQELINLTIWDAQGRKVEQLKIVGNGIKKLDMSALAAGIYLLQASSDSFNETIELVKINAQEN